MSDAPNILGIVANLSAIATAVVAAGTAAWFWKERRDKRRRLEDYLERAKAKAKQSGKGKGQRSILHLMAALGMSEAEILQAAFRSTKIARPVAKDENGFASHILLEFKD